MQQNEIIRIAVLDDDLEFRELLMRTLSSSSEIKFAGSYSSCDEALNKLEEDAPDILLLDIEMPWKNGIDSLKEIKQNFPSLDVLMLTVYSDSNKIFESLRNGAVGYMLKKSPSEKLIEAIKDAKEGGAPFSGEIARKVLEYFKVPAQQNPKINLSDREKEVLEALIDGHSTKAIADKLFVSYHTVRFHLHNIYNKLHVNSRAEAIAKVLKNKIV
jgi:DNA-binding NarL/FixJ family response regulator